MEATPEQAAEGQVIVKVLSVVLDRLVSANISIARADPGQVTKFHAMKAPAIGIEQYLERILKYAACSNECFILALIYIDRLIQRNNFLLTELNVHRVVVTAILLAAKFFDDAYYNNAYYAKVGGVLVSEMNGLEVDFLFRINFSLHVSPEVFQKYRAELLSQASGIGIGVPPPVAEISAPTPVTQQVQPQMQHPQSAQRCAPVTVQYTNHALAQPSHTASFVNHTAYITPSPPAEAGIVADAPMRQSSVDMGCSSGLDSFVQVQRSYSEPAVKTNCYSSQPSTATCGQTSFSAPVLPVVTALQYQVAVEPMVAVDHRIYTNQNGLVHHQHGEFRQQGASTDYSVVSRGAQHLVANRMLAGLSGAGM